MWNFVPRAPVYSNSPVLVPTFPSSPVSSARWIASYCRGSRADLCSPSMLTGPSIAAILGVCGRSSGCGAAGNGSDPMRMCWWAVVVIAVAVLFAATPSKSDEKRAGGDTDGFVPLFPEPGVPKGWVVRAWDDVAKPAPDGAAWRVDENGVLHGSDPRGTWLVSEREYGDLE